MKKRIGAVVLCFFMALSLVPFGALADGEVVEVSSAEQLEKALLDNSNTGKTIKLKNDISVSKYIDVQFSVTIDGSNEDSNDKYGYCISSSASRILRITSSDVTLNLNGIDFVGNVTNTERGLQVDTNKTNVTLNIDQCSVTGVSYYAINICTGAKPIISIKDSYIKSWGALNLWSDGYTVKASNSIFEGNNNKSYNADGWNNFGTIVLEGDTTGQTQDHSSNCTVDFDNCEIVATQTTGNKQFAFLFNSPSASNIIKISGENTKVSNAEGCFFLNNGTGNVLAISAGYFATKPDASTIADGYAAVANTDEETMADYPWMIANADEGLEEIETTVSAGETPKVTVAEDASQPVKDAATAINAGTVEGAKNLEAAASTVANDAEAIAAAMNTDGDIADAAATALTTGGVSVVDENTSISLIIEPYLEVSVQDATTNEASITLSVDITPKYNIIATTAEDPDGIVLNPQGDNQQKNAVIVAKGIPLDVPKGTVVDISLPISEALYNIAAQAPNALYVQHKGHQYTATVSKKDSKYYATFTNPDGFSTFVLTTENSAVAKIGNAEYTTLQAAVDAVKDGETITIVKPTTDTATVSEPKSFKVQADDGVTNAGTIQPNPDKVAMKTVQNTNTYYFGYAAEIVKNGEVISGYPTISAAVGAAGDNATINLTMLANVTEQVTVNKPLTINLPLRLLVGDTIVNRDQDEYDYQGANLIEGSSVTKSISENGFTIIFTKKPTDSGSSGGASVASYDIVVADGVTNGAVTPDRKNVGVGTRVTVTVTPDAGYKLDQLTATDKDGKEVALTQGDNGTYTFIMPSSKVTLSATFVKDGAQPTPPADNEKFVDVPKDAYYHDAVYWAVDKGITEGTDATHFSPDATCTRAQMVTFLWRAAGQPAPASSENPFTDVKEGAYYYDAVLWAVEKGITVGTSATTFSPDATVIRGQAVTFLWRCEGKPAPASSENPFTDVTSSDYFYQPVLWAVEKNVTAGTSKTTFSPQANCLRSQVVTFLNRAAGQE